MPQARLDQPLELRLPTADLTLLAQTTVRASKQPTPLDVPLPPKKRASVDGRRALARAR